MIQRTAGASHRSSLDYQIQPESLAGGLPRGQSPGAQYIIDASLDTSGGPIGTSLNYTLKPGFAGQLYDITTITFQPSLSGVFEEGQKDLRELDSTATLDDGSQLRLRPAELEWSLVSGPLTLVEPDGIVTADAVFENTDAIVQATHRGGSGQHTVTVINTEIDNLAEYAGDGLDDAWQVNFFGLPPNPDAAPAQNPDGDPHDNRFEFLTGYDPTDRSDFFTFKVIDHNAGTATLQLSKIIPGTFYRVVSSTDLGITDFFGIVTEFSTPTEEFDHPIIDSNAPGPKNFYRVGVFPADEFE